jgi:NAD(P)-dependent dehydrogenase (short-subunit alcohol dehydrogenase family)
MDLQLTGKRAFVTGGSRGIGKAIARTLAEEGCDVGIAARDPDRLRAAADELAAATGRRIVPVVVDTRDDASVRRAVDEAVAGLGGGIDVLVNNAAAPSGQSTPPRLAEITRDALFDDVETKVMGYLRCAQAVAPGMIERGWGRIVNISGLGARSTGNLIGSVRNVGVAALTKNLADELGPKGISVTVVHPGLTRTEATPGVVAWRADLMGLEPAVVEERMARSNSLHRLIDASEIADVVAFLASPRAGSINGDAVVCGGGQPGVIHY